jgi:hypothetical protein
MRLLRSRWSLDILRGWCEVWWGRRCRLPTSAGPRPALGRAHEPSRNRVIFEISDGPSYLVSMAFLTVEPFIHLIRRVLALSGELASVPVRHHRPSTKIIKVPPAIPSQNGTSYEIRNPRVFEPERPGRARVQLAIGCNKRVTGSGVDRTFRPLRQRAPQTPSQE